MLIYEMYGRAAEALEAESRAHLETIAFLRRIKAGEVDLDEFGVTENAWFLIEKPEATDGDPDSPSSGAG